MGELIWDEILSHWTGSVRLSSGQTAKIHISAEDPQSVSVLPAHKIFENIRANEYELRQFAARSLLQSFNEEWTEGENISSAEFCRGISPESVHIYEDQSARIYYHGDDLLTGHSVIVNIDEYGRPDDAFISG